MERVNEPRQPAPKVEKRSLTHDVIVIVADSLATGAAAYVGAKLAAGSASPAEPAAPGPAPPPIIFPPGVEPPQE